MDIFDNIKDTLSKTGKSAVKKTKDLAGVAKLTAEIEETKGLLEKAYEDIGKKYCSLYDQNTAEEAFSVNIATVKSLTEHLEELKIKRLNLRGKVVCDGCKNSVSDEFVFCPNCGKKLPEKSEDDDFEFEEDETGDIEVETVDTAESDADLDEEVDDEL